MAAAFDRPAGRLPSSEPPSAVCVRIDRAMQMLAIGKTKLYQLIAAGDLETIHIGRRTLVLQASIEALVERLRRQDAGAAGRPPHR
jgi:hypothetical protein